MMCNVIRSLQYDGYVIELIVGVASIHGKILALTAVIKIHARMQS